MLLNTVSTKDITPDQLDRPVLIPGVYSARCIKSEDTASRNSEGVDDQWHTVWELIDGGKDKHGMPISPGYQIHHYILMVPRGNRTEEAVARDSARMKLVLFGDINKESVSHDEVVGKEVRIRTAISTRTGKERAEISGFLTD